MDSQILFYLIIGFIIIEFLISRTLSYLNGKSWQSSLPSYLRDYYNEDEYKKAANYHQDSKKVAWISSIINVILILAMLLFDGFALLDNFLRQYTEDPILLALAFFGILTIPSIVIGLPFSWYSTFHIEEKYGFNKSTKATFIMDQIKGIVLGAVIGGAILSLLIFFYNWAGTYFWLYAWIAMTLISLFFATFATSIFVPIFNKLSPLDTGELKTAIENYAVKVNFPLKNIFIMDGSKRSSKANAFFSGLGRNKSIVLYDTLVESQTTEELVAVLAHEVGHYKKKHIPKSMIISILNTGILFFILGWALGQPMLSEALGATHSFHIGILAFSLLYSPISMITGIFMNYFSRKNEYEADHYAKTTYGAAPMISALKKLSTNHLSNLTPHPAYVFMYYSHPTLIQRIAAIKISK